MVLHNINVQRSREGQDKDADVKTMMDKIGIGIKHENYEELIAEATVIIEKYGKDSESATVTLK